MLNPHPLIRQVLIRLNEKNRCSTQKDQQMKQTHSFFIISGALIVSAALITGLASVDMTTDRKHKLMMHAQKLDTNDDGAINLDELVKVDRTVVIGVELLGVHH